MRLRRAAWGLGVAGWAVLITARPAGAHGLGSRGDLPLPVWMFAYGAAAALLISFAGLAVFWRTARLEGGGEGRVVLGHGGLGRALWVAGRVAGLALFVLVFVAAAFGDVDTAENLAPVFVYVVFWVGLILVCALVGDLWRVVNPFDTLARGMERLAGRRRGRADGDRGGRGGAGGSGGGRGGAGGRGGGGGRGSGGGPERAGREYRWGRWPAVAGLVGFVWLELVYPYRAEPRTLAVAIAVYTVLVLAGTVRWGRDWLQEGEAFTVFFALLGRMAPLYADPSGDGRVRLRAPLAGLVGLAPDAATQAIVILGLGSTSFDGLSRTRFWQDMTRNYDLVPNALISTAGLVWAVAVVTLAFVGAMRITARLYRRRYPELTASFAHSLVPIVFAYALAHYFSLLVFEGQGAVALVSDPLGRGWDLFGTAGQAINFTLISATTIAYVQAAGIVAGHVAGVVMAHDRALALFRARDATRSQYPLLGAMVLFTVGGLALLLGA